MARLMIDTKEMDNKSDVEDRKPEWETTKAPAGAEWWKGTSRFMNGDVLGAVSGYDTNVSKFSQFVKVEHNKAFTLKPLILTSGPLKGAHVLMLEATSSPVTSSPSPVFRFMDLVAELRCKIYGHLLEEDEPIKVSVYQRRPVREGYGYESRAKAREFVWNGRSAKWMDQPPSNMAMLQVNKQIRKEAAPIAYGNNTFSFAHSQFFKAFVRGIGSMCEYVKRIEFPSHITWIRNGRTNPWLLLGELTSLRTLNIGQDAFEHPYEGGFRGRLKCRGSVVEFVGIVKEPLEKLRQIHEANGSDINVLDIFQITGSPCPSCSRGEHENHPRYGIPPPCTCHEVKPERRKLETLLRSLLAQALKIEDGASKS